MPYPSEARRTFQHFNDIDVDIIMPEFVIPSHDYSAGPFTAEAFLELQNQRNVALVLAKKAQLELREKPGQGELEKIRKRLFRSLGEILPVPVTQTEKAIEKLYQDLYAERAARGNVDIALHNQGNELEALKKRLAKGEKGIAPYSKALERLQYQLSAEQLKRGMAETDLYKRNTEFDKLQNELQAQQAARTKAAAGLHNLEVELEALKTRSAKEGKNATLDPLQIQLSTEKFKRELAEQSLQFKSRELERLKNCRARNEIHIHAGKTCEEVENRLHIELRCRVKAEMDLDLKNVEVKEVTQKMRQYIHELGQFRKINDEILMFSKQVSCSGITDLFRTVLYSKFIM